MENITYFLVIVCWIFVIVWFIIVKHDKEQDFVRLSILFMSVFYLIPITLYISQQRMLYLSEVIVWLPVACINSLICFLLFLIGFFSWGFIRPKRTRNALRGQADFANKQSNFPDVNKARVGVLLFLGIAVYAIYLYIRPASNILYLVRSGEAQGSHFLVFLQLTSSAFLLSVVFLTQKGGGLYRLLSISALIFLIFGELLGSTGRMNIVILLSALFFIFLNIRARIYVIFIPLVLIILGPIIMSGKQIIWYIASNGALPNFNDVFFFQLNAGYIQSIINNTGHAFISMLLVDGTIKLVGVRYFFDYIQGFLFYLKVIGLDFGLSLTYFNTENILGLRESIIPTGYLAFGYIQALHIGVFLSGIVYRLSFSLLHSTRLYKVALSKGLHFYFSIMAASTFYMGEVRTLVIIFVLPTLIFHFSGILATRSSWKRADRNIAQPVFSKKTLISQMKPNSRRA